MKNQNQSTESLVLNQNQGFKRSEKYRPIKTQKLIDTFESQGFEVTAKVLTRPRKTSKIGYQKHMIRLTRSDLTLKGVNDSRPEIVIINSADGSTSLRFLLGIFRMVCANGMVVGDTFDGYRVRHTGNVKPRVIEALDGVIESFPRIANAI